MGQSSPSSPHSPIRPRWFGYPNHLGHVSTLDLQDPSALEQNVCLAAAANSGRVGETAAGRARRANARRSARAIFIDGRAAQRVLEAEELQF
jgi:hypothetical protein